MSQDPIRQAAEQLWLSLQAQSSVDSHQVKLILAFAKAQRASGVRALIKDMIEVWELVDVDEANDNACSNQDGDGTTHNKTVRRLAAWCEQRAKELE